MRFGRPVRGGHAAGDIQAVVRTMSVKHIRDLEKVEPLISHIDPNQDFTVYGGVR